VARGIRGQNPAPRYHLRSDQEPFRKDADAIRNLLIATPGQHLPLSQFADIKMDNGAWFIYRESNSLAPLTIVLILLTLCSRSTEI
jgi:Cu/Ag efflux pump CusA